MWLKRSIYATAEYLARANQVSYTKLDGNIIDVGSALNDLIENKEDVAQLNNQISELNSQNTQLNNQVTALNNQVTELQNRAPTFGTAQYNSSLGNIMVGRSTTLTLTYIGGYTDNYQAQVVALQAIPIS